MIEADFLREYHIYLEKDIKKMSWRKFMTLLSGLSSNSVFGNICSNKEHIIEDPEEAEKAVNNIWG